MNLKIMTGFVILALTFGASAQAQEHPRFAFKTWVPGETTKTEWYTKQLAAETAWGHGGFYLHEVVCQHKEVPSIELCSYERENSYFTFYDGLLSEVAVSYTSDKVEDVHDQLVAKYGPPQRTLPYTFRNDVGANVPYKRYVWDADGSEIRFDEIWNDLGHAALYVVDRKLEAAVKAATTKSEI